MNLIFNTLLLCHVLDSSLSYIMYQTMLDLRGFLENSEQVQSSGKSNSEDSQSYSGGVMPSYDKYKYKLRSDSCRRSRKRCHCVKCGSTRNNCCEDFCQKYCSSNIEPYMTGSPITPGVLVMPYPVPVVLIASTGTTSQSTSEDLKAKNVSDVTTTITATTSVQDITGEIDKLTHPTNSDSAEIIDVPAQPTEFPKLSETQTTGIYRKELRNIDMDYNIAKYKGRKRFSIITPPHRRKMNNPEPKSRLKGLPKYGLVSIPQILLSMIKQLKEERKSLTQEKKKLLHFYKKSKLTK